MLVNIPVKNSPNEDLIRLRVLSDVMNLDPHLYL